MSDMTGNHNYESSYGALVRIEGKTITLTESENTLRGAQVTATLALAYEQRTANLIALWQSSDEHNPLNEFQWAAVRNQITARMGIYPEGVTK